MFKIWIFGDSFAASTDANSWAVLLEKHGQVINKASNGSSEHRIWKKYQQNKQFIKHNDIVIFCHTSSSRIFLKEGVSLLSRLLPSYQWCDLIVKDIYEKKEKQFINLLKKIWDDEYFEDIYSLLVKDLEQTPNSIHINFFSYDEYHNIWLHHSGNINHLDKIGNSLVLEKVLKKFYEEENINNRG
jgi:hypothetical protein